MCQKPHKRSENATTGPQGRALGAKTELYCRNGRDRIDPMSTADFDAHTTTYKIIKDLDIEPSQVAFPWRAALRTGFQTALTVLSVLIIALPMVSDFVAEFWPDSPVIAWIAGGTALAGALAALLTRIMAIPGVDELLTRFGMGAEPK